MNVRSERVSRRSARHVRWSAVLFLVAFGAAAAGCGGGDADAPGAAGGDAGTLSFAPELEVDVDEMEEVDGGLRYRDLEEGSGEEILQGQVATVHYTGWLPSGEQFDSSRGAAPFQFTVGAGDVISGWDEGVPGMRVGGRRQLVIPPDLAYGPAGAGGVIPPNATLVFEVELLAVD
jgi:FKBP-type peptidyl-prolyl cis-trans isomerase FkpA